MHLLISADSALAFLAAYSVKATLLLAAAWILVIALRHRSAALRHRVWTAGILSSLALPVSTLLLPAWHSAQLSGATKLWTTPAIGTPSGLKNLPAMIVNAAVASPLSSKMATIILSVWFLGFFIAALRLVGGLTRLRWAAAHATPLLRDDAHLCLAQLSNSFNIARPVRILQSSNPLAMPVTWGILQPRVLFPGLAATWPADRLRIVLSHELAHIARHDWFLQVTAELARAFYWFHPLAHLAARSMRQESERACDDTVLNSGIEASHYARQLLDLAQILESPCNLGPVALAIARPTHLERRFIAMLNTSIDRRRLSRRAGILTSLLALCLLFPLAALRLPAQNASGAFSGTIHDPSGAGVRNATVIMTDHKANTTSMTASGPDGNFTFKALPAGEYQLKVLKQGFATFQPAPFPLDAGQDLSQKISLEIASISEEVDFVAEGTGNVPQESQTEAKPARLRLAGKVEAAKLLDKVIPTYPDAAKAAGIQGIVVLHAVIGMNGKPLSLRVTNDQIDPQLARAAVEAVSKWRYTPTLLNGAPIEVDTTINVNFSLLP